MSQQFFNNRAAVEAHLLGIEAALTQPIAGKPARLRDRILAKAVVFLADQLGQRATAGHADLARRITVLEQRPTAPFFWPWTDGSEFSIGAFVTYRGALWQSERPTKDEPGGTDAWTLIVGTPAHE